MNYKLPCSIVFKLQCITTKKLNKIKCSTINSETTSFNIITTSLVASLLPEDRSTSLILSVSV
uniref:Uncharacterized protein n=1 Tax=Cannabis sativa TaxID=3483 RepID=A0A803R5W2_CANSA